MVTCHCLGNSVNNEVVSCFDVRLQLWRTVASDVSKGLPVGIAAPAELWQVLTPRATINRKEIKASTLDEREGGMRDEFPIRYELVRSSILTDAGHGSTLVLTDIGEVLRVETLKCVA